MLLRRVVPAIRVLVRFVVAAVGVLVGRPPGVGVLGLVGAGVASLVLRLTVALDLGILAIVVDPAVLAGAVATGQPLASASIRRRPEIPPRCPPEA